MFRLRVTLHVTLARPEQKGTQSGAASSWQVPLRPRSSKSGTNVSSAWMSQCGHYS